MGPPAVSLVLLIVLSLTATLPHHNVAETTSACYEDNECSSLQIRQDLLESSMITSDILMTEMYSQLFQLSKQFKAQQNEGNIWFNRINSHLDAIETAISDPLAGVYTGCQDALTHGHNTSGVYTIAPDQDNSFNVYCEQQLDGGGWTVFQSRQDGSVDFYQDWRTYKVGFGTLTGEFWLGNMKINLLTRQHDKQLKIELESSEGEVKYADYSEFWISNSTQNYKLHVSGYSGGDPPGDSLVQSSGYGFSTKDEDHDMLSWRNSARASHGAWWYQSQCYSSLNGMYGASRAEGIYWAKWKDFTESMKATRMMVRRRA